MAGIHPNFTLQGSNPRGFGKRIDTDHDRGTASLPPTLHNELAAITVPQTHLFIFCTETLIYSSHKHN